MVYEIQNSKALMGACFIHYLIYCVFYSIDALKTDEFNKAEKESEDPNVRRAREQAQKRKENGANNENTSGMGMRGNIASPHGPTPIPKTNEFETVSNKKPIGGQPDDGVDMKDIELKEENKNADGVGPGPRVPRELSKNDDEDEKEEDLDGYNDDGMPFFNQVVNRFPKVVLWYFLI